MSVREQFPQMQRKLGEKKLVYLDSAATTLKPQIVIDRLAAFYSNDVANVHRGAHQLAEVGTRSYEHARGVVAEFIQAEDPSSVVFTRGTTESLNLAAAVLENEVQAGDEILVTLLEHHSNFIPWQQLAKRRKAVFKTVNLTEDGEIDYDHLESMVNSRTKIFSFTGCSNVTGAVTDFGKLKLALKQHKPITVCDSAQAVTSVALNVNEMDVDFLAFSGHKIFAPFGIGVLYGKFELLKQLGPYQTGGSMIDQVSIEDTTWALPPFKFEAGTPNVSGAIALATAIDWFKANGGISQMGAAKKLATELRRYLREQTEFKVNFGDFELSAPVVSFNHKSAHASDVAMVLDQMGIAIRAGHHCCQPLLKASGLGSTVRASFSIYNDESDLRALIEGLEKVKEIFS